MKGGRQISPLTPIPGHDEKGVVDRIRLLIDCHPRCLLAGEHLIVSKTVYSWRQPMQCRPHESSGVSLVRPNRAFIELLRSRPVQPALLWAGLRKLSAGHL